MIIGLTGRKGHGKDTVAARLRAEHDFRQLRFADPLKQMMRAFYFVAGCAPQLVERKIEGDLKEEPCEYLMGRTPRHAMQTLGTEWGRNCIHPELWVQTLQRRAADAGDVVVTDVRFENECAAIHRIGGIVARVDAGQRVARNAFSDHPSEAAIDTLPVDEVLDNSGPSTQINKLADSLLQVDAPPLQPEAGSA